MSEKKPFWRSKRFLALNVIICSMALVGSVLYFFDPFSFMTLIPSKTIVLPDEQFPYTEDQLKRLVEFKFLKDKDIQEWRHQKFKGESLYEISSDETGENVLKSSSRGTSSGIFRKVNIDIEKNPILVWKWKVTEFPSNKKNKKFASKLDNDYPLRIYAIFEGKTIFTSDIIQYVWDDHFEEGTYSASPYTKRVKAFVVQKSSAEDPQEWVREMRDIRKDYEFLFGKKPTKNLKAIGIMSDSDNTMSQSEAFMKNIEIYKLVDFS